MRSVVIVAGGSGSRMNSQIPKQFMEIHKKPVIVWTMEKFLEFDPSMKIVLVLPENHLIVWQNIESKFPRLKNIQVTTGGATRFHSVQNGLKHVSSRDIVGIHDAVRPLVSMDSIRNCYEQAMIRGSAVPVVDMEDSLRRLEGKGSVVIDRRQLKRVQTPQVFKASKLIEAYENSLEKNYTDDASVYESYFGNINLVEGNPENIKITYPADMKMAAALLKSE